MQHGGHTGDDTYGDFYAPRNPGTDGQNSYLGDKPRTIVNDWFRAMTLSRNPELWQSLPAEKQHELENTPEFLAIEEELEQLASKFKDDSAARDRRKELYAQKRKLVSEELRRCQKLQPRKAAFQRADSGIGRTPPYPVPSDQPVDAPTSPLGGRSLLPSLLSAVKRAVLSFVI